MSDQHVPRPPPLPSLLPAHWGEKILQEIQRSESRTREMLEGVKRQSQTSLEALREDLGPRILRLEQTALEHRSATVAIQELRSELRQRYDADAEDRATLARLAAQDRRQTADIAELQAAAEQHGGRAGRAQGVAWGGAVAAVVSVLIEVARELMSALH